jgi:uncharacterized protein (DUF305 family)
MPLVATRAVPFLALLLLSGCTGARTQLLAPSPATTRDPAALAELENRYWAEIARQRTRFAPADVAFMQGMILHHAQALAMVSLVEDRTEDRSIRLLSGRIENSQRDEIRLMESWLEQRGQPRPEWMLHGSHLMITAAGHDGHGAMDAAGADPHSGMPGMLSDAQMAELEASTGLAFERLFLTFMIQHHEGAVEMVRTLFATDGAAQDTDVFRFASDVQVDQVTEIRRMEGMLRARAGSELPSDTRDSPQASRQSPAISP